MFASQKELQNLRPEGNRPWERKEVRVPNRVKGTYTQSLNVITTLSFLDHLLQTGSSACL